ncbi:hypothetical protein [Streptomyces sp. NBC_01320]|uniref:hypothetical protein n=1 Tax=Streptomyces sp. NBC_01320 TaxID=2903824 RepID=UPI002E15C696|nr:hypothetical protein OG395_56240 [Streptomyces sp. NBC_01320]
MAELLFVQVQHRIDAPAGDRPLLPFPQLEGDEIGLATVALRPQPTTRRRAASSCCSSNPTTDGIRNVSWGNDTTEASP